MSRVVSRQGAQCLADALAFRDGRRDDADCSDPVIARGAETFWKWCLVRRLDFVGCDGGFSRKQLGIC